MSFYLNATSNTVAVSGSIATAITVPGTGQTLKGATMSGNGGTQTIATITAGKTGYITQCIIWGSVASQVALQDNAGAINYIDVTPPANGTVVVGTGQAPICKSYAAGEAVKFYGPNTSKMMITYVEV